MQKILGQKILAPDPIGGLRTPPKPPVLLIRPFGAQNDPLRGSKCEPSAHKLIKFIFRKNKNAKHFSILNCNPSVCRINYSAERPKRKFIVSNGFLHPSQHNKSTRHEFKESRRERLFAPVNRSRNRSRKFNTLTPFPTPLL